MLIDELVRLSLDEIRELRQAHPVVLQAEHNNKCLFVRLAPLGVGWGLTPTRSKYAEDICFKNDPLPLNKTPMNILKKSPVLNGVAYLDLKTYPDQPFWMEVNTVQSSDESISFYKKCLFEYISQLGDFCLSVLADSNEYERNAVDESLSFIFLDNNLYSQRNYVAKNIDKQDPVSLISGMFSNRVVIDEKQIDMLHEAAHHAGEEELRALINTNFLRVGYTSISYPLADSLKTAKKRKDDQYALFGLNNFNIKQHNVDKRKTLLRMQLMNKLKWPLYFYELLKCMDKSHKDYMLKGQDSWLDLDKEVDKYIEFCMGKYPIIYEDFMNRYILECT